MRGAWQLFQADLKNATRNVMAVIVLCGLIVIPSIFTWLNVIASWEPFNNTGNLKVAVASVDEGYTSPLIPVHINVGNTVESTLRANTEMDWIITTKEDAVAGTKSGDYYAAMVLPKDFSERMLTFYAAGSKQTEIEFYTNDKSNPLAPLITSEGADDLSAKINAEFTQELDNIALSLIDSLADSLSSPESVNAFQGIQNQVGAVGQQLSSAADTANMFAALLESSVPLANSSQRLIDAVNSDLSAANGKVQSSLQTSAEVQQAITNATAALSAAFTASNDRLNEFENQTNALFDTMQAQSAGTAAEISALSAGLGDLIAEQTAFRNSIVDLQPNLPAGAQPAFETLLSDLDAAIAQERAVQGRIDRAAADVTNGGSKAEELRAGILNDIGEARATLSQADNTYINEVKPLLDELGATLVNVGNNFGAITNDLSYVGGITTGAAGLLERAATDTGNLAEALTKSSESFALVQQALGDAIATGDIQKLVTVIGSNPATLAAAISQPIGLDRIPVYPVVSFGAGMAPLYTMLSLWVGALLMCVTLRVEPPTQAYAGGPQLSLNQQFFGRYGIFAVLGLAQSTLVFGGNILLVGLAPVHPFLFMLAGWITSLVFTFFVYTLVVSLSDAGKALAVVLLVIQVAGAGGAYPLPLLPQWFQNISPFLPGTHTIDAIRSSMAGIYRGDYWVSIGWLACFIVPALLLGLVLRKPLIGLNKAMERMLQSTKLM